MKRSFWVIGGLALAAAALNVQAVTLYSNFDPTALAPDYSTSNSASLSGSCNSAYCHWINTYSAGFNFTPTVTGLAAKAYLPFDVSWTYGGSDAIYGLTISDSIGNIVARGGFYRSDMSDTSADAGDPAYRIDGTAIMVFDLSASTSAGQSVGNGILSPTAPQLMAGETYHAYFTQTFGPMSTQSWYMSDEMPAAGQATTYCSTNGGGYCAYWDWGINGWNYPLGASFTAPLTSFLPALTITDGSGYGPAPSAVPVPAAAWLLGSGLLGLAAVARRRHV
jgi:hypothetical protein